MTLKEVMGGTVSELHRAHYDGVYHAERHAHLINEDEYFLARAEVSPTFYFSRQERSAHIFDYGMGIGQEIAKLPNAAGWDFSPQARQVSRSRGLSVFDSLDVVPRQDWDFVLCRHVLEHIEEPLSALGIMRELLKVDGKLVLVLPMEHHQSVELAPDLNQHLYCWNFRTINNLLYRAGLRPISNTYRYILGYRVLLPLRRWLGTWAYRAGVRLTGRVTRNGELVIRAVRA